jgi:hypothetical protein
MLFTSDFVPFFYRFSSEQITSKSQAKTSFIRNLRKDLLKQYPSLAPYLDDIIPKKQPLVQVKWYLLAFFMMCVVNRF